MSYQAQNQGDQKKRIFSKRQKLWITHHIGSIPAKWHS